MRERLRAVLAVDFDFYLLFIHQWIIESVALLSFKCLHSSSDTRVDCLAFALCSLFYWLVAQRHKFPNAIFCALSIRFRMLSFYFTQSPLSVEINLAMCSKCANTRAKKTHRCQSESEVAGWREETSCPFIYQLNSACRMNAVELFFVRSLAVNQIAIENACSEKNGFWWREREWERKIFSKINMKLILLSLVECKFTLSIIV